jgi:transposase
VDDFALRRGHSYGTILIDIITSRPVDVLPDRTAASLTAWLDAHPGVQIICRDRAGCYAQGATSGAPDAIQIADRWHMWRNLGDAVERTVAKHRAHLRRLSAAEPALAPLPASLPAAEPDGAIPAEEPGPGAPPSAGRRTTRTQQRYADVQQRIADGQTLRAIARELGLARNTVRKFARATSAQELLVNNGTGKRPKQLDAFDDYLRRRWADGCTNAAHLHQELQAMGYQGGATAVRQHIRTWRSASAAPPPAPPPPPTVRQATGWFLRNPAGLDEHEQRRLDALTQACPPLAAVRTHVRAFADMMLNLRGHQLDQWMAAVQADDLPELHSFVAGLHRDYDAARAGLTMPYSSGPVEGHVNRIKMLKRQMYGRANPDLLRKRILLAD